MPAKLKVECHRSLTDAEKALLCALSSILPIARFYAAFTRPPEAD